MIPAFTKVALRSPSTWFQVVYRLALLGLVGWLLTGALRATWHFTIDDSGISYAYAKHLAEGLGPVAAPGAPWVEGYSNALWVFFMIPLQWLGVPLPEASKWLGVTLFASMLGAGVWLLAKDYGRRLATAALGSLWIIVLGVGLETVIWVVAGLENALLGALLLGLAALDRSEREHPERFPLSGLAAFALCITRPEGIMYAAPVLALRVFDAWRAPQLRRGTRRLLIAFLLPLVLYHGVHYAVFHEWVPNTYYAKPQGRSLGRGLDYLVKNSRESGLRYVVPLALLGCYRGLRNKAALIWYCCAGVFFILYSGGDWMPHSRFVSFFAPALVLLGVHGVYNIGALLLVGTRRYSAGYRSSILEGTALVGLVAAVYFWHGYHAPRLAKAAKSKYCHFCQRTDDARKLQKVSKAAQLGRVTVLTHDFGGPSWVSSSSYYPIDFLGLCDASIARIRRAQQQFWVNSLLSPHVFHEQAHSPSWIYLPKNFWRHLKDLPEFDAGYYSLSSRLLPHAPGGSYVALHKGHLVDYFPPVNPVVLPQRLSSTLGLAGLGWFADGAEPSRVESGARLRVVVSVLPLAGSRGNERVWVEVTDAGKRLETRPLAIARGLTGLPSQLAEGEPLRLDFSVTLPALPAGDGAVRSLGLKVGVSTDKRSHKRGASVTEVTRLGIGDVLPVYERFTARVPSGLPAASHPELISLQGRVATVVDGSYLESGAEPTSRDEELAAHLRGVGDSLLAAAPDQAYLAYVWATQVNTREWEHLTKPLLSLRRPIDDATYGWEWALLNDYYTSILAQGLSDEDDAVDEREPVELVTDAVSVSPGQRLVAFYEHIGRTAQATYFRARGATEVAPGQPWATELTFEGEQLDWTGDLDVFGVDTPDETSRLKRRGLAGTRWLSSQRQGTRAKGAVLSPLLTLAGPKLSFLFAGGGNKSDVGVELLVAGKVVRATATSAESVLHPVWWDIAEYTGETGQLRVYDKSSRRAAYLDQVVIWK